MKIIEASINNLVDVIRMQYFRNIASFAQYSFNNNTIIFNLIVLLFVAIATNIWYINYQGDKNDNRFQLF